MAKYRVLTKSFINNSIAEEGDIVEFDGKAGSNLELIAEGKKGVKPGKPEPEAGEADNLV